MVLGFVGNGVGFVAAQVVARVDDGVLERSFGTAPVLRAVFERMARRYRADVVPGFTGTIVWVVTRPVTGGADAVWSITVDGGRAVVAAGGPAASAASGASAADGEAQAVQVRVAAADLARIGLGAIDPAEPLLHGRATFSGDLGLAARLAEMFGAPRPR